MSESNVKFTRDEALDFHARGRPGKIEIIATKPMATQRDLSLAYSPGVAVPVEEIAKDPGNPWVDHRAATRAGVGHNEGRTRYREGRPMSERNELIISRAFCDCIAERSEAMA